MDKQKLITLAEEVGFKSKFFSAQPYKYSHKEDMRWYMWMCELEAYLMDGDIRFYAAPPTLCMRLIAKINQIKS